MSGALSDCTSLSIQLLFVVNFRATLLFRNEILFRQRSQVVINYRNSSQYALLFRVIRCSWNSFPYSLLFRATQLFQSVSFSTTLSRRNSFSRRNAFSTTLSPLTHNVRAAWRRRGEVRYSSGGTQTFIFPLHFPRRYTPACAKPPVRRSAFFR